MPLKWSRYLIYFFVSCTQHFKNRKNRKPRISALKLSIGISALGLSTHICPTCRYVRPCISLNTSNWPLKLCGHILEYIYGWLMGNFFFDFLDPIKQAPALNSTRKIVKWFNFIILSNHFDTFLVKFLWKLVKKRSKKMLRFVDLTWHPQNIIHSLHMGEISYF